MTCTDVRKFKEPCSDPMALVWLSASCCIQGNSNQELGSYQTLVELLFSLMKPSSSICFHSSGSKFFIYTIAGPCTRYLNLKGRDSRYSRYEGFVQLTLCRMFLQQSPSRRYTLGATRGLEFRHQSCFHAHVSWRSWRCVGIVIPWILVNYVNILQPMLHFNCRLCLDMSHNLLLSKYTSVAVYSEAVMWINT